MAEVNPEGTLIEGTAGPATSSLDLEVASGEVGLQPRIATIQRKKYQIDALLLEHNQRGEYLEGMVKAFNVAFEGTDPVPPGVIPDPDPVGLPRLQRMHDPEPRGSTSAKLQWLTDQRKLDAEGAPSAVGTPFYAEMLRDVETASSQAPISRAAALQSQAAEVDIPGVREARGHEQWMEARIEEARRGGLPVEEGLPYPDPDPLVAGMSVEDEPEPEDIGTGAVPEGPASWQGLAPVEKTDLKSQLFNLYAEHASYSTSGKGGSRREDVGDQINALEDRMSGAAITEVLDNFSEFKEVKHGGYAGVAREGVVTTNPYTEILRQHIGAGAEFPRYSIPSEPGVVEAATGRAAEFLRKGASAGALTHPFEEEPATKVAPQLSREGRPGEWE